MHATVIPEWAVQLRARRAGKAGLLPLVPRRFAHVVIDIQNGFMAPDGLVPVAMNEAIMPNLNRISAATRQAQGTNIFVRFTYDADWRSYYGRFDAGHEAKMRAAFTRGAPQHELFSGLDVDDGDLVLDKTRFSSFTQGTCALDALLQARGIDTLIVTGCTSNCCCESTVRDGLQMNYNMIFVHDACAAMSDSDHNSAVSNIFGIFGCDVCTTDEVISRMESARS
jgi:ureidoacrylate peracid hydrolase